MDSSIPLQTHTDLQLLVEEIGFLPLFHNEIPGFSVEDLTPQSVWFDGGAQDPWQWRKSIAAGHTVAYGKFFRKKAGFVSRRFLPYFVNVRRDGYDFDALYEDGKASREQKRIMDLFVEEDRYVLSHVVKRMAAFKKNSRYQSAITQLQMQFYLIIAGFDYKRNKAGAPYGWPVSLFATPETVFGYEYVRSRYHEQPEDSKAVLFAQAARLCPKAEEKAIGRLLL